MCQNHASSRSIPGFAFASQSSPFSRNGIVACRTVPPLRVDINTRPLPSRIEAARPDDQRHTMKLASTVVLAQEAALVCIIELLNAVVH